MPLNDDYVINSNLNNIDNEEHVIQEKCHICRDILNDIPLLRVYITMVCPICLQEENQFMMRTCGHGTCLNCCIEINERTDQKLKYFLPDGTLSLLTSLNANELYYNRLNITPIINRGFHFNGKILKWKRLYSTNIIILRERIDRYDDYSKFYECWDKPPVPHRYDDAKWCNEMFWWYSTI